MPATSIPLQTLLTMSYKGFVAGAQASAAAAKGVGAALDGVTGVANAMSNSIYGLTAPFQAVQMAAQSVIQPFEQIMAMAEEAASRKATRTVFANVMGGADEAAAALRALQQSSRYTVNEIEAMDQATTLMSLGLAKNAEELGEVSKVVSVLGGRFGGNLQTFSLMMSNQSLMRVDSFGLGVAEVTAKINKFKEAGLDADEAWRKGFMEAAADKVQQLGGATAQAGDAFAQMRVAVDELKIAIAELGPVVDIGTKLAENLRGSARFLSGFYTEEYAAQLGDNLQAASGDVEAFAATVQTAFDQANAAAAKTGGIFDLQKAEQWTDIIRNSATSVEEYRAGLETVNAELQKQVDLWEQNQQKSEWLWRAAEAAALASFGAQGKAAVDYFKGLEEKKNADKKATIATNAALLKDTTDYYDLQAEKWRETQAKIRAEADTTALKLAELAKQQKETETRMADEVAAVKKQQADDTAKTLIQKERDVTRMALQEGWRKVDQDREVAKARAAIAQQYADAIAAARQTRDQSLQQAAQQHAKTMLSIEKDYQKRLRQIQRDYDTAVLDAAIDRDAIAIYTARRTRDEQLRDAAEGRQEQEQSAQEQYREQVDQINQAYQEQLAAAEDARRQSLAALAEQLRLEEEERQRAAARELELQKLTEQWLAEDQTAYLTQRQAEIEAAYATELATLKAQHAAILKAQAEFRDQLMPGYTAGPQGSSTGRTTRRGGRAGGGYTHGYGQYTLAETGPEFVLNPDTTRRLEQAVGGNLTQSNITSTTNSPTISISGLTFSNVGAADRQWIEARLAQMTHDIANAIGA